MPYKTFGYTLYCSGGVDSQVHTEVEPVVSRGTSIERFLF